MLISSGIGGDQWVLHQHLCFYPDVEGLDLAIISSVRTLCSLKSDTR